MVALGPAAGKEPGHDWLIQAKLTVRNSGTSISLDNRCGLLVLGPSALGPDEAAFSLDQAEEPGETETLALPRVVDSTPGNPSVALRCTEKPGGDVDLSAEDMKITALELGSINRR